MLERGLTSCPCCAAPVVYCGSPLSPRSGCTPRESAARLSGGNTASTLTLRLMMASRGALRVRITRRRQDAEDRHRIDPHEQPERPSVGHEADARSERRRAGCGPPYKAAVLLSRPPFGLHHWGRARARSVGATASCGIGRPRGIEGPGPWPRLHRFPEPRALAKSLPNLVAKRVRCGPLLAT
jgi:hypothetical protein